VRYRLARLGTGQSWPVSMFLPRDAMQARPMLSCGVRLSVSVCVCVSVTFVHSVKTNKRIFTFLPLGNDTTRVFSVPNGMTIFRREPLPTLTRASNAGGVGRSRDSEPILASLRAVNSSSGKCNTFSCDRPRCVCNTSRW